MGGNILPKPKKPRTVDIARDLVLPLLEGTELELWDVRFEKEGSEWYLRYLIDKPGGVTITDLEELNRALGKLLDEADPIDHSYILEVSSPGLERELITDAHFARYTGHRVDVRLIRPRDGARNLTGILAGHGPDGIRLELDGGEELPLGRADCAWVRLHAEIESGGLTE